MAEEDIIEKSQPAFKATVDGKPFQTSSVEMREQSIYARGRLDQAVDLIWHFTEQFDVEDEDEIEEEEPDNEV